MAKNVLGTWAKEVLGLDTGFIQFLCIKYMSKPERRFENT